jgi:hypothetical protein
VVGGLVEQEHIGLLEEEPHERHAALLAAREVAHARVRRGRAEGVHRLFELRVEVPEAQSVDLVLEFGLLGHERVEVGVGVGELGVDGLVVLEQLHLFSRALLDDLADGLVRVELRLLVEHPERDALLEHLDVPLEVLVLARDDLQEGGLAGPVEAEHADLGAVIERKPDIAQDGLAVLVRLGDAAHREDDFLVGHGRMGNDGIPVILSRRRRIYAAMLGAPQRPPGVVT